MTRYIVIGAGAVGGALAGSLVDAGIPAVAVARGEHATAIAERGLSVRTPDRAFVAAVPCVRTPEELALGADDVLVVTTKTDQAEAALRQWTDVPVLDGVRALGRAGDLLPVLVALNGVTAEEMALRYFTRVLGVCVWVPAVHLEPGEVLIRATPAHGTMHVGTYPAGEGEADLLAAVQRDWTVAGFQTLLPADVMPWKYRKLISNIGNVFEALAGGNGRLGPLIMAAQHEARQVLAAAGKEMVDDATEAAAREGSFSVVPVPGEPERIGGSTWQSLSRHTGTIETDFLNGEIVRLAHKFAVPAPVNTAVAALARQAALSGRGPGLMSTEQLAEQLGLGLPSGADR